MKRYLLVAAPFVLMSCSHSSSQAAGGQPAPQVSPAGVSLAGTWVYNPDDSDQPGRYGMVGGSVGGRGGYGGRGGIGGMGGGGGGRGFGRGRGDQDSGSGEDRDTADSLLRRPAGRLVITQTDSTVTITPRDADDYTLFADGRDVVVSDPDGRSSTLNARWNHKRFEVRRTLRNGATLTESYEVKRDGKRLVVHVKLRREDSGTEMPEFQRVYDRYGQ